MIVEIEVPKFDDYIYTGEYRIPNPHEYYYYAPSHKIFQMEEEDVDITERLIVIPKGDVELYLKNLNEKYHLLKQNMERNK